MGELEALNTIGSIIGTFLPTFVTIPAVGTARTFLIFAGILLAMCLVLFQLAGTQLRSAPRRSAPWSSTALMFGHQLRLRLLGGRPDLEDESIYNYLQVTETDDSVILSTNVAFGVQSRHDEGRRPDGHVLRLRPGRAAAWRKRGGRAILGLGTGTYATSA